MGIGMGGFPRKEVERGEVEKIAEKNRTPIKKVITTEEGWCKDVIYYSEEVSTIVDFVEYLVVVMAFVVVLVVVLVDSLVVAYFH